MITAYPMQWVEQYPRNNMFIQTYRTLFANRIFVYIIKDLNTKSYWIVQVGLKSNHK